MGTSWSVQDDLTFEDAKQWKNPDEDNKYIKAGSSAPEEVHLNPEDLDLNPEDVQADCDVWVVQPGPS